MENQGKGFKSKIEMQRLNLISKNKYSFPSPVFHKPNKNFL
jgi:hypothetical protein